MDTKTAEIIKNGINSKNDYLFGLFQNVYKLMDQF